MQRAFEKDILDKVRIKLATSYTLRDEDVKELITETIFSESSAESLSVLELKNIADRTFLRIRSPLGILTNLVEDKSINEIMVNGFDRIFVEKDGSIELLDYGFYSTEELEELMQNIAAFVHREINELHPIVDARLNDGSRVNGVFKNIAAGKPVLTIRKFSDKHMKLDDLVQNKTLNQDAAQFLGQLVKAGYNIFVSGGTSSGKTTVLNALSDYIPDNERVIVIEDSLELQLSSIENLIQLECRQENITGAGKVTMAQLIKTSLRMRPDRIIVGEVRGEEVLDMLQAMNTGHSGSMSTGHGNSVRGMLRRLEAMFLTAVSLDIHAVRAQIAEGIDIMIHIEKTSTGRKITEITELVGYENGQFILNNLMTLNEEGILTASGNEMINGDKLRRKGMFAVD